MILGENYPGSPDEINAINAFKRATCV